MKKRRINIIIEHRVWLAARKFAKERYEVGTFSRMVALALVEMMKKGAGK